MAQCALGLRRALFWRREDAIEVFNSMLIFIVYREGDSSFTTHLLLAMRPCQTMQIHLTGPVRRLRRIDCPYRAFSDLGCLLEPFLLLFCSNGLAWWDFFLFTNLIAASTRQIQRIASSSHLTKINQNTKCKRTLSNQHQSSRNPGDNAICIQLIF